PRLMMEDGLRHGLLTLASRGRQPPEKGGVPSGGRRPGSPMSLVWPAASAGFGGQPAMDTFELRTHERNQFVEVTDRVRQAVRRSGVGRGLCVVYCPHTPA